MPTCWPIPQMPCCRRPESVRRHPAGTERSRRHRARTEQNRRHSAGTERSLWRRGRRTGRRHREGQVPPPQGKLRRGISQTPGTQDAAARLHQSGDTPLRHQAGTPAGARGQGDQRRGIYRQRTGRASAPAQGRDRRAVPQRNRRYTANRSLKPFQL